MKNNLFEKTQQLEGELNDLIENIELGLVHCENNKEEILHYLIHASHCVSKVYKLNLENMVQDYTENNLTNFVDKGGKII